LKFIHSFVLVNHVIINVKLSFLIGSLTHNELGLGVIRLPVCCVLDMEGIMFQYYVDFWKMYVDFEGKTTRSRYWYVAGMNALISSFLMVLMMLTFSAFLESVTTQVNPPAYLIGGTLLTTVVFFVFMLAIMIPTWAISVRRLRDGGFPWGLFFLTFIPGFGPVILIIFMLMPTKQDDHVLVSQAEVESSSDTEPTNKDTTEVIVENEINDATPDKES